MSDILSFFIPIPPVPCSRPRIFQGQLQYSPAHVDYLDAFKTWYPEAQVDWQHFASLPVSVDLEFHMLPARTTKLDIPRPDLDNLVKLALDCLTDTALVWDDDRSVARLSAAKMFIDPYTALPATQVQIQRL